MGGPDSTFSMNPGEFADMVTQIRTVEKALGTINYDLTDKTKKSRVHARSLFVCEDVKAGQVITTREVRSIRPGAGLHPRFLPQVLGRKAKTDLKKGTPFSMDMVE
jgi:sialic acid synthase SpsE